jgi:hypothetical protein
MRSAVRTTDRRGRIGVLSLVTHRTTSGKKRTASGQLGGVARWLQWRRRIPPDVPADLALEVVQAGHATDRRQKAAGTFRAHWASREV